MVAMIVQLVVRVFLFGCYGIPVGCLDVIDAIMFQFVAGVLQCH